MQANNEMEQMVSGIGKKTSQEASHVAKRLIKKAVGKVAKQVILTTGRVLISILGETAPVWVPIVVIIVGGFLMYNMLYLIPKQVLLDGSPSGKKIAAFYGSNDPDFIESRKNVFEDYADISKKWSDKLTDDQKIQAQLHAMPWGVIAAVDRIVNDPATTGKKKLLLQPDIIFEALRPAFTWRSSTITNITQSCSSSSYTDKEGNVSVNYSIHSDTKLTPILLLAKADTFEGAYNYDYKQDVKRTEYSSSCGVLVNTEIKEILAKMNTPDVLNLPLMEFLKSKGIKKEVDIQLAFELAKLYDIQFKGSSEVKISLPYVNGAISGANLFFPVDVPFKQTTHFGDIDAWHSTPHKGMDIATGTGGTHIYAIDEGVVEYAGAQGSGNVGYGYYVILSHPNGLKTLYAHLQHDQFQVQKGDRVKKGQYIAQIGYGKVGDSTGPHLHFELNILDAKGKTTLVDPLVYVKPAIGMMTLQNGTKWIREDQ
ncbi:M23 family metallopeptidase [Paenibacillus agricola]|uniref:M23 family metallopeptidase n=1 Tax=Paenibacillus agricola TaxID=2716264 RepID=A0ABX0JH60_9BACL|nr:M23 family metallopeptidase [Paenibacillus agricola]NHN34893.1 M23 family metallopeptidase [Paenibacillus agricola]